jgi:DNA-directed RNA polymerase subunit beta
VAIIPSYIILYKKILLSSEIEAVATYLSTIKSTDPPDEETASGIIDKLFFSDKRYNLGEVGRYKINKKLTQGFPLISAKKVLTKEDIIAIVKYLVSLINAKAELTI